MNESSACIADLIRLSQVWHANPVRHDGPPDEGLLRRHRRSRRGGLGEFLLASNKVPESLQEGRKGLLRIWRLVRLSNLVTTSKWVDVPTHDLEKL